VRERSTSIVAAPMPRDRIADLCNLFDEYNEADFGGKLNQITLLIQTNSTRDGWYEYAARKDWTPIPERLHKAAIMVAEGCWEEDNVEGTLIHEMVHQYQCEVLGAAPHHDKWFNSFARKLERKYGFTVR
jgi:hypothetical protein